MEIIGETKNMMLKLLILAVVLCFFSLLSSMRAEAQDTAENVVFVQSRTTQPVSLPAMIDGLAAYDVVVFGEFHDSQPIHDAELAVLKGLYQKHGANLVLSMEMFERDVQPVMNQYLAGTITEAEFLNASRPWPQYKTAYRPLVEFAKAHHIPVLTGNIPRRMAAVYAKTQSLEQIAGDDKQYLPKVHWAGSAAYREKFAAAMQGMNTAKGGMNIPPQMVQPMFMAQCLKDDAMAESISQYRQEHTQAVVYHVVGNFHSAGHLGMAEKLAQLQPKDRIAVIDTVHYNADTDAIGDIACAHASEGEYLALETAHAIK